MDREDVIRKIQYLLNVAEESNGGTDSECQTALTMARKLMAKHNIELSDLDFDYNKVESHEEESDIFFNTRYCLWKLPLAQVISKHCACAVMLRKVYKAKNSRILFVGEKDNPKLVTMMFKHAVMHIESNINRIHARNYYLDADYRYSLSDSYAKGFIDGLKKQYEEQDKKDPGTALMVVRPHSIDEYFEKLNVTSASYNTNTSRFHSSSHYNEGYNQGRTYGQDHLEGKGMVLEGRK